MQLKHKKCRQSVYRRGDTLIEVMMSFAIFSVIVTIAINSMNAGISSAEASLELTLARSEIESQAEAIRFLHNAFLSEREFEINDQEYLPIWKYLKSLSIDPTGGQYPNIATLANEGCENLFIDNSSLSADESVYSMPDNNAFVVNTRNINIEEPVTVLGGGYYNTIIRAYSSTAASNHNTPRLFSTSSLNPRIIFSASGGGSNNSDDMLYEGDNTFDQVSRVEGLWDLIIQGDSYGTNTWDRRGRGAFAVEQPGYYDFHINACWNAPGKRMPTTLTTIVRLYNPEYMEMN